MWGEVLDKNNSVKNNSVKNNSVKNNSVMEYLG